MSDAPEIQIDPNLIKEIASQALDEKITRLGKWQAKSLKGGADPDHRLFRISGKARTSKADRNWSLVLKIATCTDAHDSDPTGHHFWARRRLPGWQRSS